ncbi:MAG: hypothetical protein U0Q16_01480 [Bryobacteraceae bacterium]
MSSNSLLVVMTLAVTLSAIALVAQACFLFATFKAVQALRQQITVFLPKAETFLKTAEKTVQESHVQVKDVAAKATAVLDSTHKQLTRVDTFVGDATSRAKVQMDRMELILDDTVSRVHETVMQLNQGVLRPMREINGLAAGVRAAVQHLVKGNRPNVAAATSDEEMFI